MIKKFILPLVLFYPFILSAEDNFKGRCLSANADNDNLSFFYQPADDSKPAIPLLKLICGNIKKIGLMTKGETDYPNVDREKKSLLQ